MIRNDSPYEQASVLKYVNLQGSHLVQENCVLPEIFWLLRKGTREMASRLDNLQEQLDGIPVATKPKLADGAPFSNWSGIGGSCTPSRHHYPQTIKEVQAIIAAANMSGAGTPRSIVRVAGSALSPNTSNFTEGHMIHTHYMRKIHSIDTTLRRIKVQAGATLEQINYMLDMHGLMIPVVPAFLQQSIGGAIANATHGTGLNVQTFSGYVRGMTIVDGLGRVHEIDDKTTELCGIKTNAPILNAAACHLGLLGVVCDVTLQVEAKTMCRLVKRCLTVQEIHKVCAQRVMTNDYYRFVWTPHTDFCYESIGQKVAAADEERASTAAQSIRSAASQRTVASVGTSSKPKATPQELQHARIRVISRTLKKIPGSVEMEFQNFQDRTRTLPEFVRSKLNSNFVHHTLLEHALWASTYAPCIQPSINRTYRSLFLNDTVELLGTPPDVLVIDVLFRQHAMEFALDANRALDALEAVRKLCEKQPGVHFPLEVRFADEERTWLAPTYGRKTVYVGLVMFVARGRNAPCQPEVYREFEAAMTKLGGRPHWGKETTWQLPQYQREYPMLPRFLALRAAMDPKNIFCNTWAKKTLGI